MSSCLVSVSDIFCMLYALYAIIVCKITFFFEILQYIAGKKTKKSVRLLSYALSLIALV